MDDSQNLRATAMIALRDVLRFVQTVQCTLGAKRNRGQSGRLFPKVGNSNETIQAAVLTTS
jgi:hypothetical protein